MDKVERYRRVFRGFKSLCARGEQTCSFRIYCQIHGVSQSMMPTILKGEFKGVKSIPGYRGFHTRGHVCMKIYEEFKQLCAAGNQPGSFKDFCEQKGIKYRGPVHAFLKRHGYKVDGLPGYAGPAKSRRPRYAEIPFEDVIFEEAGFLPAAEANVITVSVDGHVAVSFPADTDVAVIAKFIKKMGKEAWHVES